MTKRSKAPAPEDLVALAHRKLNLGRHQWFIECLTANNPVLFTVIHIQTRRRIDRHATFQTRARREGAFLEAVAAAVAELRQAIAAYE